MQVLMFGWEFPPYSSGGLGTACFGLTKGLRNKGADVTFVIPAAPKNAKGGHVKLIVADSVKTIRITSIISPYMNSEEFELAKSKVSGRQMYGDNLFNEVYRYSIKAGEIARHEQFDVIHSHDWMTYPAGIRAKEVSGKPLVVHVHATEFDRTGGNVNQQVYNIEREGLHAADAIITVSNYTKNIVCNNYGISPDKVTVVHNAVDFSNCKISNVPRISANDKVVLFLGRITIQKGPDYFIESARRVLEHEKNVKFIVAGTGDMAAKMINRAAELGIADKVLFTGFLSGADIDRAYKMADLYVMPSISEPFGITPLESMRNGTPVLISKQSGVSEVINNCLKVDFWDIDEMTNKILAVLRYPALKTCLSDDGAREVSKFSWDIPAEKCLAVYSAVCGGKS